VWKRVIEYELDNFITDEEEQCSYWIKPPEQMEENDYFEIGFSDLGDE